MKTYLYSKFLLINLLNLLRTLNVCRLNLHYELMNVIGKEVVHILVIENIQPNKNIYIYMHLYPRCNCATIFLPWDPK